MMTVKDLLSLVTEHAEDPSVLNQKIVVKVGPDYRDIDAAYVDGTLILVAGMPML